MTTDRRASAGARASAPPDLRGYTGRTAAPPDRRPARPPRRPTAEPPDRRTARPPRRPTAAARPPDGPLWTMVDPARDGFAHPSRLAEVLSRRGVQQPRQWHLRHHLILAGRADAVQRHG